MSNTRMINILLAYGHYSHIASTVADHINAFKEFSRFSVTVWPLISDEQLPLNMDMFDVVIIHYSLSIFYSPRFSDALVEQIKAYQGIKVIFIQDEYRCVNKVIERLNYMNFNYLFTCVPEEEIEKVYPAKDLPNLEKINTLTGFVPKNLLNRNTPSFSERTQDVVYRARKISAWYGRLPQEKWKIAVEFSKYQSQYNLACDIAYREEDRIYGEDWINFISHSKATLGVESGANVFDFTGTIQPAVEEHEELYPDTPFEVLERTYFPNLEGKIIMNQISPRCFESAALRTMMILFEGNYSGILKPWRHFVPLKKDFSNISEVVSALKDEAFWLEMTHNTYNEVALNPKYSFENMVKEFDIVIGKALQKSNFKPVPHKQTNIDLALKLQNCKLHRKDQTLKILEKIVKYTRHSYRCVLGILPVRLSSKIKSFIRKIIYNLLEH